MFGPLQQINELFNEVFLKLKKMELKMLLKAPLIDYFSLHLYEDQNKILSSTYIQDFDKIKGLPIFYF